MAPQHCLFCAILHEVGEEMGSVCITLGSREESLGGDPLQ